MVTTVWSVELTLERRDLYAFTSAIVHIVLLLTQELTLVTDVPKHLTKWNCYKNISENTPSLMASNTGASTVERVLVSRQVYKATFEHIQDTSVSTVKRVLSR